MRSARPSPAACAAWRPFARATLEKSTAVTCHPRPASQSALRPSPHARSSARPGGRSASSASTQRFGAAVQTRSAAAYRASHSALSMRSNGHNRVEHLFGLATAQIVDPIRFPRARLEVGVLDGYLLPGPQQPAKTGLAGLDHDDLSAAACAGLWPSLKGRSHRTTVLAPVIAGLASHRSHVVPDGMSAVPPRVSASVATGRSVVAAYEPPNSGPTSVIVNTPCR